MDVGWRRVKQVFEGALALPDGERSAFLNRACEGDQALRAQIEELLSAESRAPGFLDQPTRLGELTDDVSAGPRAGETIGRYKLLEQIGEGGFGVVFMAEQTEPVTRRVALKVIKLGMDTRQVIARFEAERQALALMDHPNIARVLDAGATDEGRPYFVMELVRGVPITEYCDTQRLTPRERLDLFVLVCRAVQHAHTKGVIHRDIKPSNVLVTMHDGVSVPKVIDFGIAKATGVRLTDKTLFTQFHQFVGTPAYMSPEQAEMSGLDIDTRTDVYSLGVLLHELLVGVTPFDSERLRSVGYDEARRIIREEEPPRPSTRLSAASESHGPGGQTPPDSRAAQSRRSDPRTLTRFVRGDLDWIILKCLSKGRTKRYETASDLAADIERFLRDEPITAHAPGRVERLRKMIRRNRPTFIAGAIVAIALVTATSVSVTFWLSEARHRRIAQAALDAEEVRSAELEQVAAFQGEMLQRVDPDLMGRRLRENIIEDVRMAHERAGMAPEQIEEQVALADELLIRADMTNVAVNALDTVVFRNALETVRGDFAGQPLVRAALLGTLSEVYLKLGKQEAALPPMEEALDILRNSLGHDHPETLTASLQVCDILATTRRLEDSRALSRETYSRAVRVLAEDDPIRLRALHRLAANLESFHEFEEAESLLREELEIMRRVYGLDSSETERPLILLAQVLRGQERVEEAEPFVEEGLRLMHRRVDASTGGDRYTALFDLAFWLRELGRPEGTVDWFREALEQSTEVYGEYHSSTLTCMNNIAYLLMLDGRYAEAEPMLRDAYRRSLRARGEDNPGTLATASNLGTCLGKMGRSEEAETLLREVLERRRRVQGDDNLDTLRQATRLARHFLDTGRLEDAESLLVDALPRADRVLGDTHEVTNTCHLCLARIHTGLDRYDEAERHLLACEAYARAPDRWNASWGGSWREAAVALYTVWHATTPAAGYDSLAAEYQAMSEEPRSRGAEPGR